MGDKIVEFDWIGGMCSLDRKVDVAVPKGGRRCSVDWVMSHITEPLKMVHGELRIIVPAPEQADKIHAAVLSTSKEQRWMM